MFFKHFSRSSFSLKTQRYENRKNPSGNLSNFVFMFIGQNQNTKIRFYLQDMNPFFPGRRSRSVFFLGEDPYRFFWSQIRIRFFSKGLFRVQIFLRAGSEPDQFPTGSEPLHFRILMIFFPIRHQDRNLYGKSTFAFLQASPPSPQNLYCEYTNHIQPLPSADRGSS